MLVDSVRQPAPSPGMHPIIEVAFKQRMWWSLPADICRDIHENFRMGQDAVYVWDWGDHRAGSWRPSPEEETSLSWCKIDFEDMIQTNIDNGRKRSIRIIWVRGQDLEPRWSGEKPE